MAPLLAVAGGGAVAVGAWLPWMSYFAGLIPLRGIIGINGRLLLGAGVVGVAVGISLARDRGRRSRRAARWGLSVLGIGVVAAAGWLLLGVRELTRIRMANSMLAPRPGVGLLVVLVGGALLALVSVVPDQAERAVASDAQ